MSNSILLGCHVPMAKPDYLLGSAQIAVGYGANTFMIYTGAPQNSLRVSLNELRIKDFQAYLKDKHIDINNIIVHAPYVVNLATNDVRLHHISTNNIATEVYRTMMIGCKYLVLHPGNATNVTPDIAISNICKAINEINRKNNKVIICLETMSGKGSEVGRTFQEIAKMISLIDNKDLIGVCLDTCHINDAGYDVQQVDNILNEFDQVIGLKYLKVIHLNDSKNEKGSKKDRHENIGYGTIGFKTLCNWIHHPKLVNIPKILETPYYNDHPVYKEEIQVLRSKTWEDYRR